MGSEAMSNRVAMIVASPCSAASKIASIRTSTSAILKTHHVVALFKKKRNGTHPFTQLILLATVTTILTPRGE